MVANVANDITFVLDSDSYAVFVFVSRFGIAQSNQDEPL